MVDKILYLDGTSSTIKVEVAYELTKFDASRSLYVMSHEGRNYIWLNNTWMEE